MKKMSKGMLMTALICGAVYLGGSPVYASELQEFSLDEYVVTAARTETKLVDTPANITVVDAQTIEERHYQDVSEVLKDVPGANVLDCGDGTSEKKIMLNGDERVLILIDGRRVNFDMGTMSRSGYDMNQLPDVDLIERIEILKGAGGALYGSEAVGGVVNIITKKADRSFGKISMGYGSMGAEDYSAMYSFKEGKTGVTVAASKYEQDYYKYRDAKTDTTKRWPGNSDFKNEKISFNINQEVTENSNITIGYDYSKFEGTSLGQIDNPYGESYIEKKSDNIYAKYDWGIGGNNNGYIQYYHNELDYINNGNMNEKTNGVDIQQAISISDNNKLVYGASYRESDVVTSGSNNNYDKNIDNLAFFINDTWEFIPTWTLNVGARYDDHSEAGDETTFSTGLNKKFDDNSHAYFNWGQVFRAPTTDDLFYNGYMMYGDPNLKPETGDTWTIGYATKFDDRTNINVSYFESNIENAIDWVYGDWITVPTYARNVDEQERKGLEVSVKHKVNEVFDLEASYTYLNIKNNDRNEGFVRDWNSIPNLYRFGFRYHEGKWNADAFLRYGTGAATHVYYDMSYGYPLSKQSYVDDKYITLDIAITYKATKDLSIFAKGYNLFNEAYADQAGVTSTGEYKTPAQSRRFIVGAEYKF